VIGARDDAALHRVRDELSGTSCVVALAETSPTRPHGIGGSTPPASWAADVLVNNASQLGGISPLATFDVSASVACSGEHRRPIAYPAGAPLLSARSGLVVNITSDAASGAYRLGALRREQSSARAVENARGRVRDQKSSRPRGSR
jgi:hypothetical protein